MSTAIINSETGEPIITIPDMVPRNAYVWMCHSLGFEPVADDLLAARYADRVRSIALVDELDPGVGTGTEIVAQEPTHFVHPNDAIAPDTYEPGMDLRDLSVPLPNRPARKD